MQSCSMADLGNASSVLPEGWHKEQDFYQSVYAFIRGNVTFARWSLENIVYWIDQTALS